MRLATSARALAFAIATALIASSANAALVVDEQFEGTYFNAAQSGRGVNFDWFQTTPTGGVMGIVFYTYDANGNAFGASPPTTQAVKTTSLTTVPSLEQMSTGILTPSK